MADTRMRSWLRSCCGLFKRHRAAWLWSAIIGCCTFVAVMTGFLADLPAARDTLCDYFERFCRDTGSTGGGGSSDSGSSANSPVLPGCYRGDDKVDCAQIHYRELFAPVRDGSCDQDALVLFLGGQPGVDVLNGALSVAKAGTDTSLCSVTRADGERLEGTLEGLWVADLDDDGYWDGGQYRPCVNTQGIATSCSEPHHTEIFYVGAQSVDCRAQYENFAGRGFAADSGAIAVVSGTWDDQPACWVKVLTQNDQLTASVRRLGDTVLPLTR